MWAMQPRFERDLHAFFVRTGELGYGGVEVNHSMDAEQVAATVAVELEAARRDPYRRLSRVFHLVGRSRRT